MRRLVSCSVLALMIASPLAAQSRSAEDILNGTVLTDMEGQQIDANQALLEALITAAKDPAYFEVVGVDAIDLVTETGKAVSATIQIRNTGDVDGSVYDVTTVGSFSGLNVSSSCPDILAAGKVCRIEVSFSSERARSVSTAIVISVNGEDQNEIRVPVNIEVNEPPKVEEEPEPAPVVVQRPDPKPVAPKGPSSEDVARRYFGSMGGMMPARNNIQPGFTIVSAPRPPETPEFAGVRYDEMRIETITSQERYGDEIAATEASLPVNRDRILTADRVIKAVLETPVSNVMCGKVVALVESDVYSATSDRPLIQAGSRVVGQCGDFVNERAGIEWTRIITTDGRSITFELGADTRDATGLGGAIGRVHSSAFDRYVLPVISTMIDSTAGVVMAAFGENETVVVDENGNTISENSARNEGIRIVTGEARGTAQQIIQDIRDVREIAVIPAGSRIDIEVSEDIYFTDSRKVVRLADMTFDLNDIEPGEATRDLPGDLTLTPAEPGFKGPTMTIGGRRYKVEETVILDDRGNPIEEIAADRASTPSSLDEITGAEEEE